MNGGLKTEILSNVINTYGPVGFVFKFSFESAEVKKIEVHKNDVISFQLALQGEDLLEGGVWAIYFSTPVNTLGIAVKMSYKYRPAGLESVIEKI